MAQRTPPGLSAHPGSAPKLGIEISASSIGRRPDPRVDAASSRSWRPGTGRMESPRTSPPGYPQLTEPLSLKGTFGPDACGAAMFF